MTQLVSATSPVTIGFDTGDRLIHCCALEAREVCERGACPASREGLDAALAAWPGARVALEAGSQSAWMARHLTARGFDVHVVDPRRVQLISKDPRKTDRRDAELLARLEHGMPELLGRVHHRGEQAQADLALIRSRDQLVRARISLVQCTRGLAKSFGLRLPSATTAAFGKRVRGLVLTALWPAIEVVLSQVESLTAVNRELDRRIAQLAKERYPEIATL